MLDEIRQDVRYGVRALLRVPAFTAVATVTLGIGIGAVTVIYSVVYNVAVDPLPYRDADRLVNVRVQDTETPRVRSVFTVLELVELRDASTVFEEVVGTLGQGVRYESADKVEYLNTCAACG
jgi:hypothetical protein